ncbi:hypothetical protein GCM10025868_09830 [Angustibacter aerolatus]|uniref:Uncharacterized protein n=1 Tax=Angustibacter aerolatus TaxID=1162965 RepID=A0ABQ6JC26_9ACTN|nr:hypothetical protein GCM10025868_09830 [Angustibacter aerolatus]
MQPLRHPQTVAGLAVGHALPVEPGDPAVAHVERAEGDGAGAAGRLLPRRVRRHGTGSQVERVAGTIEVAGRDAHAVELEPARGGGGARPGRPGRRRRARCRVVGGLRGRGRPSGQGVPRSLPGQHRADDDERQGDRRPGVTVHTCRSAG